MLEVVSISKSFGQLKAVDGVSLRVDEGKIKALIGPNGAGKTTLVNLVTGVVPQDSGEVIFDGKDVSNSSPHSRSRLGLARTYQIPKSYANLTVMQNVLLSSYYSAGLHDSGEAEKNAMESLGFVGLGEYRDRYARELPSEQQKLLDLARALATQPKYLFIDEIGAGLGAEELAGLATKIKELPKKGTGVVYVGHIMRFVKAVADSVMVLSEGKIIFEGTYEDAVADRQVIRVYIGDADA